MTRCAGAARDDLRTQRSRDRLLCPRGGGRRVTGSRAILLVEDNQDDEDLTLRALKRGNVLNPVVVARDGAEALKYLCPADAADVPLPGYRTGANAYVRKPVNFSDFAGVVSTLGSFWLLLNEAAPEFIPAPD